MRDKFGRFIKGHKQIGGFQKGHPQYNTGRTYFKKEHKFWLGKKRPNVSGKNHHNWKNGKIKDKEYILIRKPEHPFAIKAGYIRRSHLIIEQKLGRYLLPNEVVHHINGIKDDDRLENLIAFINNSIHKCFHGNPNKVKSSEIVFDGHKLSKLSF